METKNITVNGNEKVTNFLLSIIMEGKVIAEKRETAYKSYAELFVNSNVELFGKTVKEKIELVMSYNAWLNEVGAVGNVHLQTEISVSDWAYETAFGATELVLVEKEGEWYIKYSGENWEAAEEPENWIELEQRDGELYFPENYKIENDSKGSNSEVFDYVRLEDVTELQIVW